MILLLSFVLVLSVIFYALYFFVFRNINFDNKKSLTDSISTKFEDIYSGVNHKKYFIAYFVILVFMTVFLLLMNLNIIITVFMIAVIIYLPFFVLNAIKKRRLELFEKQLPDAIDLMAGSLKSGNSLVGAFGLIAEEFPKPLSDEIGLMVREQKLGISVDESLQNFSQRMPYNSVILTVSTIRTSIQTGGELSDALKNIANTLRSIERAEGKIKALTAQGKMQAWVVGLMPICLIIILSKMEPAAMSQLWSTKEGYIALSAIAVFELLGVMFIKKIVDIDV